ncbi:MAG TPA: hypothetical protein VES88_06260 [Gemmatimonadaceae bacterium]|nr:hypothetical protein [Gemmatimonadaceae bacterium]
MKILARWAMKTYLMIDLIFPSHRRVIPPFAYPGFRRYGTPPKQCVVWIAAYGGNKPSFTIHSGSAAEVAPAVFNNDGVVISGRTGPIGARCTFSVYRVVFQVIIMNTPLPLRGATDHIGAQKIWPLPRGPVQWPVGNMAFDDDVLLSFANRHIDVFIPR